MPLRQTNDIQTFYLDEGDGDPVVFIHGHTLDHRMWDAQVPALLAAGYRVIRHDLRGHGRSDATLTGYTSEELASDLKALLEALSVERAHLVGLSRGGGVALAFALAYPRTTRTLTLIDSILPGRTASAEFTRSFRALSARFAAGGKRAFLDHWLESPLFTPARRDPALATRLAEIVQEFAALEMTPAAQTAMRERAATLPTAPPPAERLREIEIPTLIIIGELDLPHFHAFAEEMATTIPDARRLVIEGAGHMANMEAPAAVNAALLRFLKERERNPSSDTERTRTTGA